MVSGKVAFSSVTKTDEYNGQDTGAYSVTVTLDDDSAESLGSEGIRLKEYEGTQQRKFKSKYPIEIYNMDDSDFQGEIPRGSAVRLVFSKGPKHPTWGPSTYVTKVRVVEVAERGDDTPDDF